jgi:hypothetical protein
MAMHVGFWILPPVGMFITLVNSRSTKPREMIFEVFHVEHSVLREGFLE